MIQKIRRFLQSEDGPTAVEYAVMVALIVLVCFASIQAVGTNTAPVFERTAQSLGTGS
jgi:pilus assembly protein Flp/PilA